MVLTKSKRQLKSIVRSFNMQLTIVILPKQTDIPNNVYESVHICGCVTMYIFTCGCKL